LLVLCRHSHVLSGAPTLGILVSNVIISHTVSLEVSGRN